MESVSVLEAKTSASSSPQEHGNPPLKKIKTLANQSRSNKLQPLQPKSKASSHPDEDRVQRLVTACIRCRLKKIKCDRKIPQCTNCEKSSTDCVMLDPRTGAHFSRVTIQSLETQVSDMQAELDKLRKERETLEHSLLTRPNNEFRFGKVLLMKDSEIEVTNSSNAAAVEIPARAFVESCLQSYFRLPNVQVPILHRDFYLLKYFKPLYGIVGNDLWQKILGDDFDVSRCNEKHFLDEKLDKLHKGKSLFFLYIIIAILTSQQQQKNPLLISNHYKKQAFKYIDCVWNDVESNECELSKLEMLQSLLLLTQYSLMRPCTPGAWYLVGTCVKLCQDLGLHNESMYLQSEDYYIVDLKRRLFWCCYSLDRQISIYFGRPFGIDSRQIDCPLLSTRDDLIINHSTSFNYNVRDWLVNEPQTKHISIHFINLRVLQGEIFDYISDVSNRVRKPAFRGVHDSDYEAKTRKHDAWKSEKHGDLIAWINANPSIENELSQFNQLIFELNFNQTLVQLYGMSAITPILTDENHLKILYDAGREIIKIYVKVVEQKMINFSWVAINNLYMGATVYLSVISQSLAIRSQVSVRDLEQDCAGVIMVFDELCKICYEPAKEYTSKFRAHSATVMNQISTERSRPGRLASQPFQKSISESNIFTSVGGNPITPATFIAPTPRRSISMLGSNDLGETDQIGKGNYLNLENMSDQFLYDNDFFLNAMVGSINAPQESFAGESNNEDLLHIDTGSAFWKSQEDLQ